MILCPDRNVVLFFNEMILSNINILSKFLSGVIYPHNIINKFVEKRFKFGMA